mgnify:FL=1
MSYIHELLFGVYPYLAGTVFLVGSLVRYASADVLGAQYRHVRPG